MTYPQRYVPRQLSRRDAKTQRRLLKKSRDLYKKHQFYTRKPLASFRNKPSKHVAFARSMYKVKTVAPSKELAKKTGCTMAALNRIVQKGEGAYYSSGSRPNQTPQSWGLARLASAVTGGNAAVVDYAILEEGCDPSKKALKLANQRVHSRKF